MITESMLTKEKLSTGLAVNVLTAWMLHCNSVMHSCVSSSTDPLLILCVSSFTDPLLILCVSSSTDPLPAQDLLLTPLLACSQQSLYTVSQKNVYPLMWTDLQNSFII